MMPLMFRISVESDTVKKGIIWPPNGYRRGQWGSLDKGGIAAVVQVCYTDAKKDFRV